MRAMYTTGSGCVKVFTFVSMDYDVDTCAVTLDDGSEEGLHLIESVCSSKYRQFATECLIQGYSDALKDHLGFYEKLYQKLE